MSTCEICDNKGFLIKNDKELICPNVSCDKETYYNNLLDRNINSKVSFNIQETLIKIHNINKLSKLKLNHYVPKEETLILLSRDKAYKNLDKSFVKEVINSNVDSILLDTPLGKIKTSSLEEANHHIGIVSKYINNSETFEKIHNDEKVYIFPLFKRLGIQDDI